MDRYLKTFFTALAISMLVAGTMAPAVAISSKTYSIENNIEVTIPDTAYEELYLPGEILVKFSPGVSEAKINAMNSKNGATVTYTSSNVGFKILNIPKTKSVEEMVEIYSKNPNVEYASANYIAYAAFEPNDPRYLDGQQWNFNSTFGINITEAWDYSNGTGVIVAVLDTGVEPTLEDLSDTNIVAGLNCINNALYPTDGDGHGSHVIGTIAQSTNNGIGVAGVAFGCDIMPVKVLGDDGTGNLADLIEGLRYASDHGAQVISMSLSFPFQVGADRLPGLIPELDYAYSKNVTIVCAAGNDGKSKIGYPAAYEKCIAVGATDINGDKAYYSNYGSDLDIVAPGSNIIQNTIWNGLPSYYSFSGTSMATPHVSAVAALVISNVEANGGTLTSDEVREAIESTARDVGDSYMYGHGLVDAYNAVNYYSIDEPSPNDLLDAKFEYIIDGLTVTFSDTSTPADGITDWSWDFQNDGIIDSTYQNPVYTYTGGGDYTVKLTVTSNDGDSSVTQPISVSDQQPGEKKMSSDITLYEKHKTAGKNTFTFAEADVEILDANNEPLANVQVSGHWSVDASDSELGSTDAYGIVTFQSDSVKADSGTFTFTIDSVVLEGYTLEENSELFDSIIIE